LAIRIILLRRLSDGGYGLVSAFFAVLLAQAVLPAATAVATAAVVSSVTSVNGQYGVLGQVAGPLIVLGIAVLAGQSLGAIMRPLWFALEGRINGAHRVRVARLAVSATTIAALERPHVQDLIKATSADPTTWVDRTPADGAISQLGLVARYVGLVASAAVVAAYAWWLIPLLAVPAFAVRVLSNRQWLRHFRIWAAGLSDHRYAAYWSEVATAPAEGKELRVFGFGEWLIARHQGHVHSHLAPVWADDRRAAASKWIFALITFGPLTVAYLLVGIGTAQGHATVAVEAAVIAAAWSVYSAISGVSDALAMAGAVPVIEAYEELRNTLAAPSSTVDTFVPSTDTAPPLVHFQEVSFVYPGSDRSVLDGLDLRIHPGELLAIVGLNGVGKSTLTKLLAGLYEPTKGRITANGVDIADSATAGVVGWRRQLAVVFQDFVKYQLSAADNVAFGQAGPVDQGALRAAADDAGLTPVVDGLPEGWATPLARSRTGGVDLSGGQWQQVVLARALYAVRAGARILVLDEPTAHLDVRTEFEVFQRLAEVARGASVVLISHRLSTVRQADRIVLLDGGRITESGSHDELMALGGRYAEMFTLQAERFTRGSDDQIEEGELI
jgi:ATP-binding cassette subfamily B protein